MIRYRVTVKAKYSPNIILNFGNSKGNVLNVMMPWREAVNILCQGTNAKQRQLNGNAVAWLDIKTT